MNISISKIKKHELSKLMQEEALKEGWLYSAEDVDFYFDYPSNKIYAIFVNMELAGCVLWHESLGNVRNMPICSGGFFLIINKYRGLKEVGEYLMQQMITSKINNDMIMCFHSVPRAVNFYEKKLACKKTSLANLVYLLKSEQANTRSALPPKLLTEGILKKIEHDKFNDITVYNRNLFYGDAGKGFREFVPYWMKRPDAITIAYYEHNIVKGYGIATICKKQNKESQDKLSYRFSPIYADSAEIAGEILKALVYLALQETAQIMLINSLETSNTKFGKILTELGFVESGENYIVCNHAELISEKSESLNKIFCSLPLEYPHEVVAGLEDSV